MTLLRIDSLRSITQVTPPTAQELERYEQHTRGSAITADNYRLDLSQPMSTPFNWGAQQCFVESFLECVNNRGWYEKSRIPTELLSPSQVLLATQNHFKHVWKTYRNQVNDSQGAGARLRAAARRQRKHQVI